METEHIVRIEFEFDVRERQRFLPRTFLHIVASDDGRLRNIRRAGMSWNRSSTSTFVPIAGPPGMISVEIPLSTVICHGLACILLLAIVTFAQAATL